MAEMPDPQKEVKRLHDAYAMDEVSILIPMEWLADELRDLQARTLRAAAAQFEHHKVTHMHGEPRFRCYQHPTKGCERCRLERLADWMTREERKIKP